MLEPYLPQPLHVGRPRKWPLRRIVEAILYLPVIPGGGSLFFQLVNARYEKGAMILTSNRGFAEWGDIFGSPVVAKALLDRLLHHAIVIQIDGSSYRLRRHADLLPEHIRSNALITPPGPVEPQRRGRLPKMEALHKPPENPNRKVRNFTLPLPGIFTVPLTHGGHQKTGASGKRPHGPVVPHSSKPRPAGSDEALPLQLPLRPPHDSSAA